MCWLSTLFKPKPLILVLPYPEEDANLQATLHNTEIEPVRRIWYLAYRVPEIHYGFWDNVKISLVENLHIVFNGEIIKTPALTYADTKEINLDLQWANAGVLAHEMAHIAYSFLAITDVAQFNIAYEEAKSDVLLKLLESQNQYMKTNTIELHAEIYRYLGERMPERLKVFYPRLF